MSSRAWEKFNSRTKMMKGLFNYETAFRTYTRLCLEDFVKDNIQYAEIRPNFMPSNQLYHDDGNGIIDNYGIMEIIIDEVERFQEAKAKEGGFFGGLKVIYCTPRSFDEKQVETALAECLAFKKKWPKWIAGTAPGVASRVRMDMLTSDLQVSTWWEKRPRVSRSGSLSHSSSRLETIARLPISIFLSSSTAERR